MIHIETVDGKVNARIGGGVNGETLVCETTAAVSSVVQSLHKKAKENDLEADFIAKKAFSDIVRVSAMLIEGRCGVDVLDTSDLYGDEEDESDDDDDSDDDVIVREIPKDSDVGKALMELLGIADKDTDDTADDETEDDIPDFLF